MKTLRTLALSCLMAAATTTITNATSWTTAGYVFCDANQNGQINTNDVPLTGVLVVVTNVSGSYSNAVFTATPDGGFIMQLPAEADTYVEYLHPLTLPGDATSIIPAGGVYTFTLADASNFLGSFLVSSTNCAITPPPPPSCTNGCELTAVGTICANKKTQFVFGGEVHPGCCTTNGDRGTWDVVATCLKLHLEGAVLDILDCGETQDGNCHRKFMNFQGVATLKGINGCKANYGTVYFDARAEDGAGCNCSDRLYLRVYAGDGSTLLLISGDMANPLNVVPVNISSGGLVINPKACADKGGCGDGHGHGDGDKGDKGDKGGKGDKGDCGDKGGKGDKGDKGGKDGHGDKGDKGGKGGSDCGDKNGKGGKSTKKGK